MNQRTSNLSFMPSASSGAPAAHSLLQNVDLLYLSCRRWTMTTSVPWEHVGTNAFLHGWCHEIVMLKVICCCVIKLHCEHILEIYFACWHLLELKKASLRAFLQFSNTVRPFLPARSSGWKERRLQNQWEADISRGQAFISCWAVLLILFSWFEPHHRNLNIFKRDNPVITTTRAWMLCPPAGTI